MPTEIEINATNILIKVVEMWQKEGSDEGNFIEGEELSELADIKPTDINIAIDLLESNGYLEVLTSIGTYPYNFSGVKPTSFGIFESQKILSGQKEKEEGDTIHKFPEPVGSPYGFTAIDWEMVTEEKLKSNILKVVFGHQFETDTYDPGQLISNVENMFVEVIGSYNEKYKVKIELNFIPLRAGYGEHLFNEIARDIISSDIAVFETSDLNPNVMVEMGVALTWGIRVLPIKHKDKPKPPSDISGQTWVDYLDNGNTFPDEDHMTKLYILVERAIMKKR